MNDQQLLRYSRNILLDGFDIEGQEKLLQSTVLIVGAGGLGCPAALYLAASGVGHLMIADHDTVELSNLQRQIGHTTANIGQNKVRSLAQQLTALNPTLNITEVAERINSENCQFWLEKADIVLDCTDNFAIRFLLNQQCFALKKPLISGAAIRSEGQITSFDFRQSDTACYACLYDPKATSEQSCSHNGVLAPLVGIIGSYQAAEAIKLLTGYGEVLSGRLLTVNLKNNQLKSFSINKDKACSVCALGVG
jgi:molybdopterin-synthase adenylyltransferase